MGTPGRLGITTEGLSVPLLMIGRGFADRLDPACLVVERIRIANEDAGVVSLYSFLSADNARRSLRSAVAPRANLRGQTAFSRAGFT